MHIIFYQSERPLLESFNLPDGTTLVEQHDTELTICKLPAKVGDWKIEGGQWVPENRD